MGDIQPFNFQGHDVRVVTIDGEPWWVVNDVCAVLEISNPTMAAQRLEKEDLSQAEVLDPRGARQLTNIVNEPGLYELIFRSDKPAAKAFRRWVVTDVLPAIRRDGGYIRPDAIAAQLAGIIERAKGQAEVLKIMSGVVDPAWLEAKLRHVAARALGEEPEVDLARRPLTVGEYLEERGIAGSTLRGMSSIFGKALKAEYVMRHGAEPQSVERFVSGALRPVMGYTESDRPLFDAVWAAFDS